MSSCNNSLCSALKTLCMEINDTTDCGTPHEKKMMNTTLKMWTYVVYQLIGSFENQVSKSGELAGPSAKVGGDTTKHVGSYSGTSYVLPPAKKDLLSVVSHGHHCYTKPYLYKDHLPTDKYVLLRIVP